MNTDKTGPFRFICVHLCLSVAIFSSLPGCTTPNNTNITLRKQIDELNTKIEDLNRRHDADQATIAGLKQGATTVPSLSDARVSELFTTHGLKFGRLTSGSDEGLKVYIVPTDDEGQQIKAAGSFEIEAFDLAQNGETRLGRWTFDVEQTRKNWYGAAMLYTYVL